MDIIILSQQFCEHSQYMLGYSNYTVKRYKQAISFYYRQAGISTIEEVTEANIRSVFLYGRSVKHWKTNTYLGLYKSLMVFFRWCVSRGYMASNPIEKVEIPKLEKTLPPKLTQQQSLWLLEVVFNYPYQNSFLRFRNHAIFATFIFAGLRKRELLNLKLADIDVENLTLFVRQGKGNKDRIIPISYTLALSLKRYLEERKKRLKTCPYFFVSLNLDQGFADIGLRRLVTNIKNASGIPFSVHKLRHTFATLMLEGGCDIYSLSRMMGHNDIKTTTIYLYASAEHLRSQMIKHPLNDLIK